MNTIRTLLHNLVAHPIAGICWALGFDSLGERVHAHWLHMEYDPPTMKDEP